MADYSRKSPVMRPIAGAAQAPAKQKTAIAQAIANALLSGEAGPAPKADLNSPYKVNVDPSKPLYTLPKKPPTPYKRGQARKEL